MDTNLTAIPWTFFYKRFVFNLVYIIVTGYLNICFTAIYFQMLFGINFAISFSRKTKNPSKI